MRVIHLETGMHLYGGGEQVRCLIQGLSNCGVENILVCAEGSAIAQATAANDVVEIRSRGDLDFFLYHRLSIVKFLKVLFRYISLQLADLHQ